MLGITSLLSSSVQVGSPFDPLGAELEHSLGMEGMFVYGLEGFTEAAKKNGSTNWRLARKKRGLLYHADRL